MVSESVSQPEERPLLSNASAETVSPGRSGSTIYAEPRLLRVLNPEVSDRTWRLFEFCDLSIMPPFFRRCCQSMLAAQWSHRLPLIQRQSPAELAAGLLISTLDAMDASSTKLTVIDFCSGGGGPIPVIERLVNKRQLTRSRPSVPFLLTDLQPHVDAWMAACSRSANLSFVPQPVDATAPPPSVISITSPANDPGGEFSSDTRVFRTFCLAFHHFSDALAKEVLASTFSTADGFAIFELQDRRLWSLVLMFLDFFLVFPATLLWFWNDPIQLFFTWAVPLLPFVLAFDGAVSCLRTRTFEEVVGLVEGEAGAVRPGLRLTRAAEEKVDEQWRKVRVEKGAEWVLSGVRMRHTWPFGYMNAVIGRRIRRPEI